MSKPTITESAAWRASVIRKHLEEARQTLSLSDRMRRCDTPGCGRIFYEGCPSASSSIVGVIKYDFCPSCYLYRRRFPSVTLDRATARALTDAGYMSAADYVARFGGEPEARS